MALTLIKPALTWWQISWKKFSLRSKKQPIESRQTRYATSTLLLETWTLDSIERLSSTSVRCIYLPKWSQLTISSILRFKDAFTRATKSHKSPSCRLTNARFLTTTLTSTKKTNVHPIPTACCSAITPSVQSTCTSTPQSTSSLAAITAQ